MDDRDRCRGCGKKRPADAPGGLCPACLLKVGLASDDRAEALGGGEEAVGTTTGGALLTTLAATIGPLPQVLLRDTEPVTGPGPMVLPSSPEMPGTADRFARLQLLGEVARGGMGAILKGRDTDLGRDLAVKVLLEQHREKPDLVRRFIEEAQIAGQLQHPGVVPVYELGALADRRPYFAMKLVKGRTLATLLDARQDKEDDRARLLGIFEQICLTVSYAHARGVIHRDLKPSNVMVGSFGEVQVMDWGLAKVLPHGGVADDETAGKVKQETVIQTARTGGDSDSSLSGSVMGTPAYMPPEQACGEVDRLDERADVFALGSILCEILTGQPAFTGRSAGEIQRKAQRGDLSESFGRLDTCGADAELIALAKDCLAPEREDRLRDASVVARRLTEYLAGVQERLRSAEFARVEAQARAEEEAKRRVLADALASEAQAHALEEGRRRRLQVGLAASILALTTIGGLGTTAFLHQRQAHAARLALNLKEATLLRDQAREAAGDLDRWQAAHEAVKRVEVALGEGDDLPTRRAIEDLGREVEAATAAARRDRELLAALADVRSAQIDLGGSETDAAYAEAFHRAGIDADALSPAGAAARLRDRPAAVTLQLAAYLDSWAHMRRLEGKPAAHWRRLLEVARAADPDAYRDKIRALAEGEDLKEQRQTLQDLAGDRQAAELGPASALLLASTLEQAGDLPQAVAELERAVQRHPDDVWINYTLARCLQQLPTQRLGDAVRYFTAARALRPETAHDLGHLLDSMGRGGEAIATFRELVRVRPSEPRNLGCLGATLIRHGQTVEGKDVLDRVVAMTRAAIRRRPGDPRQYQALGLALASKGSLDDAIAALLEGTRLNPDNANLHYYLARMQTTKGDPEGAARSLRATVRLEPYSPGRHYSLSSALRETGDLDGAIAEIRESIRLSPDNATYRTRLSELLKARGHDDTIAVTPDSAGIRPDDFAAHFALGQKLANEGGDRKKAIAEFRAALKIKPDDARAHNWLGWLLNNTGARDEAIAEFHEAIRRDPELLSAQNNLGNALRDKGDSDGALAAYRQAIRVKPDDPWARDRLLELLAKQNKEVPLDVYREALGIKTGDFTGLVELGRVLIARKDTKGAIAAYREAVKVNPDDAPAHRQLGDLLIVQGDRKGALAVYRAGYRDPAEAQAYYANGLTRANYLDDGLAASREAIGLKLDSHLAYQNLAWALLKKRDWAASAAAYREAVRLEPDDPATRYELGQALQGMGDYEGAIAAWCEALRLKPSAPVLTSVVDAMAVRKQRAGSLCVALPRRWRIDPELARALEILMRPVMDKIHPDEGLAVLDEMVRAQPSNVDYRLRRARALVVLDRPEQAARDYAWAMASATLPRIPWFEDDRAGIYAAAVPDPEVFELLTLFRPEDRQLWIARIRHLALRRLWSRAAAVSTQFNDLYPPDPYSWHFGASLLSYIGDREGCQRVCRRMLERFGMTTDATIARRTVLACLVEPAANADVNALTPLVEQFLGSSATNTQDWSFLVSGLYEYRLGHSSQALERLRPIPDQGVTALGPWNALACVVRAMAYQNLGRPDDARKQLAAAAEFKEQAKVDLEHQGPLHPAWIEWLRYAVLRREAEGLTREVASGTSSPPAAAAPE
jgi:serine/threonine-protein kinase